MCSVLHPLPFLRVPAASDAAVGNQKKIKPGTFPAVSAIWPERSPIRILESSRQTFHQFPLILRIAKDSGWGAEKQSRRSWTSPPALVNPYSLPWRPGTPGLMLRVTVPPELHPFPEPSGWCVLEPPGASSLCTLRGEHGNHKELSGHCK